MIRRVAFGKAFLAGASGALAWELAFLATRRFFPGGLDLVGALGTLVGSSPCKGAAIGLALHVLVGALWAVFYAYFFWSSIRVRPVFQGMIFSVFPAIAAGLTLIPQLRYINPGILQGRLPEYGFFAGRIGWIGPVEVLFFHLVYGAVLGLLYRRPVGYSVRKERGELRWKEARTARPLSKPIPPPSDAEDFMFCTGIECSAPMLYQGSWRMDELELTGHYRRWEQDLSLVAKLGIRYLRYSPPIHWIYKAPGRYDWDFADAVFGRMRNLGIIPIIDVCHFGLPAWLGNFQNEDFPKYLAEYGEALQKRYEWIRRWNPVNEMFVTARESALRGTWNEQQRSEKAFARATVNLARASRLVLKAIRGVRADAIFVTTESSEYHHACCPDEKVQAIARFENERRFIAMDLLLGHSPVPAIREYLLSQGVRSEEFESFYESPVDARIVMGLDYYAWNEKLVNVRGELESLGELFGWYVITRQYYDRYRLPILHSETNSMDAQKGPEWLWRQWHNVEYMRSEGVPVLGFTWYSLQDQIDWNIGMSEALGNVNPVGLFDLNRDPRPASVAYEQLLHLFRGKVALQGRERPT